MVDLTQQHVLFIGNSYTFTHDMPKMVEGLANALAVTPKLVTKVVAEGGVSLKDHWESLGSLAVMRERKWQQVVLQEHSVGPLCRPRRFKEYASLFADAAQAQGARVVLFQTWARRRDWKSYFWRWTHRTPAGMTEALRRAYARLIEQGMVKNGILAPVGDAWLKALNERSELELYDSDGHHPSPLGSYLTACVIFQTLTGLSVKGANFWPQSVAAREAEFAQHIATTFLPSGTT